MTRKMSELFEEFLRTYEDKGEENKYRNRMAQLAATGEKSIVVDYEDIIQFNTDLGQNLLSQPDESLREFRTAAFEVLSTENPSYASQIRSSLNVRIRGITDRISLRKVDTSHLDKMIAVSGMVVRSSELRPLLVDAAFVCPNGHVTKILQEGVAIRRPLKCDGCEETRNLELDEKKSSFIDSQILRVQELPEELPPGQLPRFFDVDVVGDIVNTARPGDRLVLTGIVRAEQDITPGQARTRVFRSKIESNLIEVAGKDPGQIQITKEDEFLIRSVASAPDAYQRLIKSIAPAILGHEAVKEAILLLLVGGPQTILPDGTKLRGDINVFVVGDPGVAKSEMLKFAAQVAPRGMFASGKGSSLDFDQPVIVRRAGTAQVTRIGELIDGYYPTGASGAFIPATGLECLSYHHSNGRIEWTPVSFVYRHRHDEPLIKIKLQTGREVVVTDDHSLYVFKAGRLRTIRTKDLKVGDHLAIPGQLPLSFQPLGRPSVYSQDLLHSRHLARLLGYYVAEGYLHGSTKSGSYRIHFELNVDEERLVDDIRSCCLTLFEAKITVRRKVPTKGITVSVSSKKAFLLFRDVLGVSQGAKRKRVPAIVFNMPRELQIEFLKAYLDGDRGVTASIYLMSDLLYLLGSSISKVGKFSTRARNSGQIDGRVFTGGPSYDLKAPSPYDIHSEVTRLGPPLGEVLPAFKQVIDSQKHGLSLITISRYSRLTDLLLSRLMKGRRSRRLVILNLLKTRALSAAEVAREVGIRRRNARQILVWCAKSGLVQLTREEGKVKAAITQKGREAIEQIAETEAIARSDLQFAKITGIKRVKATGPFVYDFSVDGTENFIAGIGGVLCHNTAAGLSAAVIREKNTFMLEAGVVVLADQGIACIDEFDKMKEDDRSALHEQMEQQTVTIAKGGIFATLNARTSILAAANPIFGKYDPYKNLTDNITLPIPLLTRFDLIFVIKDTPTPAQDERLATHILDVHRRGTFTEPPPVQFDLMKKYITYAKKISPKLTTEAENRLKEFYLQLRRSVAEGQIGATPRTLESLIRLSSARARLMLREQVLEEDALAAIALMNRMVEDVLTDTETKTKADFGILLGQPAGERGKLSTSMEIFRTMEGSEKKPVELKLFRDELVKTGRFKTDDEVDKMIQKLIKEGIIWENRPGFYRRVQA